MSSSGPPSDPDKKVKKSGGSFIKTLTRTLSRSSSDSSSTTTAVPVLSHSSKTGSAAASASAAAAAATGGSQDVTYVPSSVDAARSKPPVPLPHGASASASSQPGAHPHAPSVAAAGNVYSTDVKKNFARRASTGVLTMPTSIQKGGGFAAPRPAFGRVDTYKKLEKLGEGTYATVYKGISHVNGKLVALKEIRLEHEEGAPCTAIREVSLLKGLKHANIVTLHDIIHTKQSLTLVFEYLEKDLKQYMDDCNSYIDMDNVKLFLFQLLRGLKFCHSKKVLHRDLKPQNLLINQAGELKLADFGLARAKSVPIKTYSNEVVTLWYRPPDVLLGSVEYSTPIDMWGVGCIFSEMVSGRPLFPGSTNEDQLELIWKLLGSPRPETWDGLERYPEYQPGAFGDYAASDLTKLLPRLDRAGLALLQAFLQYDPKKRAGASDAMVHPYFADYGPDAAKIPSSYSVFCLATVTYATEARAAAANRKRLEKRRSSVRF